MKQNINLKQIFSFTFLYIIIHVLTYLIFGIIFMLVSQYFEYFDNDPIYHLIMKSSDSFSVRIAPLAQIFRGSLLAIAIYPFRDNIIGNKYGWLKLFSLLFILTSVGAVITGPGSIEGLLYTRFTFNPLIGYPEIALQMLVFSWFFCLFLNKKNNNKLIDVM